MKSDNLRPFQSFHVFRHPDLSKSSWDKELKNLAQAFFDLLATATRETNSVVQPAITETQPQDIRTAWLTYKKELPPSWVADGVALRDTENHVLIVVSIDALISVTTSDKALSGRIDRLRLDSVTGSLAKLSRLEPQVFESALIKGRARILWMSAIHRDQAIRPNAKVLIGSNLVATLDPLGDQTFHYTSVRCDGPTKGSGEDRLFGSVAPGVSPRKGRVWLRSSTDHNDFLVNSQMLLKELASTKVSKRAPFPILATPTVALKEVEHAFDFAVLPPEFSDVNEELECAFNAMGDIKWSISGETTSAFTLTATYGARAFKVHATLMIVDGQVAVHFTSPGPLDSLPVAVSASMEVFRSDALKVYYDSGHTFSGGSLYAVTTRPVPFTDGLDWKKFAGVTITQEKPLRKGSNTEADLNKIGSPRDHSLFTWVYEQYPKGYLWCDDGSGEIADFVHVHDGIISLIHVKAAASAAANREIAVSPYEVVCAQALKNIRMLEADDLHAHLGQKVLAKSKWKRAWRNGTNLTHPQSIPEAVKTIPYSQLERRVVIVQPHVTKAQIKKSLAPPAGGLTPQYRRTLQLHTMLNGFATSFRNMGIDFTVIVSE